MTVQRRATNVTEATGAAFIDGVDRLVPLVSKAAGELDAYGGLLAYPPPSHVRAARDLLIAVREAAVELRLRLENDDWAECMCGSEGEGDVCPGHVLLMALDAASG